MKKKNLPPVVLLTDFGMDDIFAGVLKGVVATISPDTRVMDLSHGIQPQDVRQAAFLLAESYVFFPKGSVFCAVVDPGVGSNRKAICIETRDYLFVGPDNGVLSQAAVANHIQNIFHLTNPAYFLYPVSQTFHGRDIFAPVCAHLSKGITTLSDLGPCLENCVMPDMPEPRGNSTVLELTIIHIDRFGNLVLDIRAADFFKFVQDKPFCLTVQKTAIQKVFSTYAIADDTQAFLISGSFAHMEISVKNGSAAMRLNARLQDRAKLEILD